MLACERIIYMTTKKVLFYSFWVSIEVFLIISIIQLFLIYSTVSVMIYPLIVTIVLFVITSYIIYQIYKKNRNGSSNYHIVIILAAIISLIISASIWKYSTTFTFEKWREKEYLRPFIVADFINTQIFAKDNDYLMSKYSRQDAIQLLQNKNDNEKTPDITYEFVDSSKGYFSSDIYFAFSGLNNKNYWLVLSYFGTDTSIKTDVSDAEIVASGEHIEKGKTIFVEE